MRKENFDPCSSQKIWTHSGSQQSTPEVRADTIMCIMEKVVMSKNATKTILSLSFREHHTRTFCATRNGVRHSQYTCENLSMLASDWCNGQILCQVLEHNSGPCFSYTILFSMFLSVIIRLRMCFKVLLSIEKHMHTSPTYVLYKSLFKPNQTNSTEAISQGGSPWADREVLHCGLAWQNTFIKPFLPVFGIAISHLLSCHFESLECHIKTKWETNPKQFFKRVAHEQLRSSIVCLL